LRFAIHFLLELAAWASIGYWGWSEHTGLLRPVLGIGLPLLAMVLWGTFRVDGDPGTAPVPVPGLLRLVLELAEFGLAAWCWSTPVTPPWGSFSPSWSSCTTLPLMTG
jgi:hypothetical protein